MTAKVITHLIMKRLSVCYNSNGVQLSRHFVKLLGRCTQAGRKIFTNIHSLAGLENKYSSVIYKIIYRYDT